MAVVLAVGLMPLPAFGDDGSVRGVSFNGNLVAGSISTTTVDDDAVVAAAGNQGMDARWFVPAASDGALAVGALDGGKGTDAVKGKDNAGGWNGGGKGTWDHSDDESSGGGGGATHIAVDVANQTLAQIGAANGPSKVLLVAGGGSSEDAMAAAVGRMAGLGGG